MRAGEIERVSDLVIERIADLLRARVSVVDDRGSLIARSEPGRYLAGDSGGEPADLDDAFSVPMSLGAATAEVVIQPVTGETVSPRLTQTLVEMLFAQATSVARLANQHELKDKFINDLLLGPTATRRASCARRRSWAWT
jgi:carbohydrate diacid regulator